MAKQRFINTKFWSDSFVRKLKPSEKLLFLYFLTNEHTEICGVYELSLDVIAFETGYSIDMVSEGIDTLSKAGKILFFDDWIYIKNFKKHQTSSPKVRQGIKISFDKVPERIRLKIAEVDTLSIPYPYPMDTPPHSNSNSDSNSDSDFKIPKGMTDVKILEKFGEPEINEILKSFKVLFGLNDFKESQKWQRVYGKHLVNLSIKLGRAEFDRVVSAFCADKFKIKNCNSLKYIYEQLKSTRDPNKSKVIRADRKFRF